MKYSHALLIPALICISLFSGVAQNVNIHALFPGAVDQPVQVYLHDDFISYRDTLLVNDTTNRSGKIELEFNIDETFYITFNLDFYRGGLYIQPGKTYHIISDSIIFRDEFRPFYAHEPLNLQFFEPDSSDLNYMISEVNYAIDNFLSNHFNDIYIKRNTQLFDSLRFSLEARFSFSADDYFDAYLYYKTGSLLFPAKSFKRETLFYNYLDDHPVLYNNSEYMHFFNTFFDDYLLSSTNVITRNDLLTAVNIDRTAEALLDTLGKDHLLLSERIRELVMIKGLNEFYKEEDFSKREIKRILNQLAKQSPYDEHRKIAKNILFQLNDLSIGTYPPDFNLPSVIDDNNISLRTYDNKPVYLNFMTLKSFACQAEMEILANLQNEFRDSIAIITVCYFDSVSTWQKFIEEKGYNWIFTYAGKDAYLIKKYRLQSLPVFMIINKEGLIEEYPARKPSENVEYFLRKLR